MSNPTPAEVINRLLPVATDWKIEDKYLCRTCLCPARVHPQTNMVWGCLNCGYSTASVFMYFGEAKDIIQLRMHIPSDPLSIYLYHWNQYAAFLFPLELDSVDKNQ